MSNFGNSGSGLDLTLLAALLKAAKPKVFVSYHHQRDQAHYERFSSLFHDGFDVITDTSIERRIGSDDVGYQQQVIREEHITGSSITIVLCGAETWKRRWVDWEIHMTLNKKHALLGIALPTAARNQAGQIIVPDRLLANINRGFANWIGWTQDPKALRAAIDDARNWAKQTRLIDNSAPRMERSRP
ncbi:MAG: TIR domain-containing protein [Planctomycetes bacterium]|nr:TIR domain-containing protein [Planctomycetota bacterium]